MFIRFVVGSESDSPRIQNGLFTEAAYLKKKGLLESYQVSQVNEIFAFFNTNLPCPPFSKKNWSIDAISWFKDTATDYIDKMRDLTIILEENNLIVRVLKTDKPGMILFEDKFQIVSQNRIY
jgi:hypothetical protein